MYNMWMHDVKTKSQTVRCVTWKTKDPRYNMGKMGEVGIMDDDVGCRAVHRHTNPYNKRYQIEDYIYNVQRI